MEQQIDAIYEGGVIKPLQPLHLAEHQRVRITVADANGADQTTADDIESFFDAANRLGYIGCIQGTAPDLITNSKYMEGFGKRGA
jgi:predicted DNA-binding antitoxin AbrB/MazE fold protein